MRPRSTVEIHCPRAQHGHVKHPDRRLPRLKGDMPAVDRPCHRRLKRLARQLGRALRNGVVPRAELELNHVPHRGVNLVRDERVLRPADDDGVDAARPRAADDSDYSATQTLAVWGLEGVGANCVCKEKKKIVKTWAYWGWFLFL